VFLLSVLQLLVTANVVPSSPILSSLADYVTEFGSPAPLVVVVVTTPGVSESWY
jgi:hypothetical protein